MEHGIIVRKTPAHVERAILEGCAFVFVEADAYARCAADGGGQPEYLPMVSGFLGSKTLAVKKSEAEYLRASGAKQILYFPDLRNVKYGDLNAYLQEIRSIDRETEGIGLILYVAVDCLTPEELDRITEGIAETRFQIMLGFGAGDPLRTTPASDVARALVAKFGEGRIWCAFWESAEHDNSVSALGEMGIHGVAALV